MRASDGPTTRRWPTKDLFAPDIDIDDARQRWLFRMIHTRRPLQEKMALFWHNHFATAYSKLAADSGTTQAAKMLAHKPGALRGPQGQIELFRQYALGNFRDLLLQVAQDPAMLVWLDGKSNTRAKPQENFGREVMELFTVGVGNYTEPDVYAAARVFTGWNLRGSEGYRQDEYGPERVSGIRLQRRPTRNQRQDVLVPDLRERKPDDPGAQRVGRHAGRRGLDHRPGDASGNGAVVWLGSSGTSSSARSIRRIRTSSRARPPSTCRTAPRSGRSCGTSSTSPWFNDPSMRFARYSWPAEFVVRAIKEVGWQGFSLDKARSPLANMGSSSSSRRTSADGRSGAGWFSTGTMLARTNFAATLAASQKGFLAADLQADGGTPQALLAAMLDRMTPAPLDPGPQQALMSYLVAGGAWTGSAANNSTRGPRALRACSSAPPSTSSFRRDRRAHISTTLHPRRRGDRHARARRALFLERDRAGAGPTRRGASSSSILAVATTRSTR